MSTITTKPSDLRAGAFAGGLEYVLGWQKRVNYMKRCAHNTLCGDSNAAVWQIGKCLATWQSIGKLALLLTLDPALFCGRNKPDIETGLGIKTRPKPEIHLVSRMLTTRM